MSNATDRIRAARRLARLLAEGRRALGIERPAQRPQLAEAAGMTLTQAYLPKIKELYAAELSLAAIAQELGIAERMVITIIARARQGNDWPPELRRRAPRQASARA